MDGVLASICSAPLPLIALCLPPGLAWFGLGPCWDLADRSRTTLLFKKLLQHGAHLYTEPFRLTLAKDPCSELGGRILCSGPVHVRFSPALLRAHNPFPMTAAAEFGPQKPLKPGAEKQCNEHSCLSPQQLTCAHTCSLQTEGTFRPRNLIAVDSGRSWESDLCSEAAPRMWVTISPKQLGCTSNKAYHEIPQGAHSPLRGVCLVSC